VAEVNTSMLDVMTRSHAFLKVQKGFSSIHKHKMQGHKPKKPFSTSSQQTEANNTTKAAQDSKDNKKLLLLHIMWAQTANPLKKAFKSQIQIQAIPMIWFLRERMGR
jgi:hypothetical protein